MKSSSQPIMNALPSNSFKDLLFTFIDLENPLRQIDIFLTQENAYENLLAHVDKIELAGLSIQVISRKRLLEMKQQIQLPRNKDLFDIRALMELEGHES